MADGRILRQPVCPSPAERAEHQMAMPLRLQSALSAALGAILQFLKEPQRRFGKTQLPRA